MKYRLTTLPLIFLLILSSITPIFNFANGFTIWSDGFESDSYSEATWNICTLHTWGLDVNTSGVNVFEGASSLEVHTDGTIAVDQQSINLNITNVNTELTTYNLTMMIYDNSTFNAAVNMWAGIKINNDYSICGGEETIGIGVHYGGGALINYSYVINGGEGVWLDTNVPRVTDTWHRLSYIMSNNGANDRIEAYLDSNLIVNQTFTTITQFTIALATPRILQPTAYYYDSVTWGSFLGIDGDGEDIWSIDDVEIPIGGTPDNSTDDIIDEFGDDCDLDVNFCGNFNDTSLGGIENTTDSDVGGINFTSSPQTLFYMFSTPRLNNTDIARAKRLSVILGENYTGIMSLTFYVSSNLESKKFQPISDNNPAYLVKSRSWQNPVKGMYWVELDSYTLTYGQVFALGVSGDSAGLMINETGNLNPLYTVSGFRPFTIVSNYNLFQQDGDIALWIELVYQVIIDDAGVIGDEGQQITSAVPIGSNSLMQNLIYFRGQLGMGDMAGGIFIGLMLTMIFIFLTALIGARMQQQIPSLVYVLMFMVVTTLNTALGFYPIYTMVLVIFIVAILSASALRNLQSGSGGM